MDASKSDTDPPIKYVACEEIRRIFADGRYFQRFQDGEVTGEVRDLGPPLRRPGEQLPRGYQEQIVRYVRHGKTIAVVHQRAGDALGNPAPGTLADPKYVFHNGTRYKFSPKSHPPPVGKPQVPPEAENQ